MSEVPQVPRAIRKQLNVEVDAPKRLSVCGGLRNKTDGKPEVPLPNVQGTP
jgi:hypothetical protein